MIASIIEFQMYVKLQEFNVLLRGNARNKRLSHFYNIGQVNGKKSNFYSAKNI